jgi:3-hydroxymyristoyl/3-hydroxydecanoyl-(acyl carrier protein) dehydratase
MRWRFVDRIESIEPWTTIRGRKVVSLEEYLLLERFGRQGVLPEAIVLESCVHLARWLVMRSSDFSRSCLLSGIDEFTWCRETGPGACLHVDVAVEAREDWVLRVRCAVDDGKPVAAGNLELDLVDLGELEKAEASMALWRELYGAA